MFEPGKLNHLLEEEAKPEASPYTLESLEAWLVKQDPAEAYNYFGIDGGCLIDLYSSAMGFSDEAFIYGYNRINDLAGNCRTAGNITADMPFTFGAALTRTRAAIAARKSA